MSIRNRYYVYVISTGEFYDASVAGKRTLLGRGYSGAPAHQNDPKATSVKLSGPLPCGMYHVLPARDHPRLGPIAIPLDPFPSTEVFGRSGFFIHGDNAKGDRSASSGCIILNRGARATIAVGKSSAGLDYLSVVER